MTLAVFFVLLRLLHFCVVILMFGISVFIVCLCTQKLSQLLNRQLNTLLVSVVLIIPFTSIEIVSIQGGLMGDGWSDTTKPAILKAVLETSFGQIWRWQIAFAALAALSLKLPLNLRLKALLLSSTFLLITLGFTGHVTLHNGLLGYLHKINHAIHLISGGYWLGTLIPLLFCLHYINNHELRFDVIKTVTRFSQLGHLAVLFVITSGLLNTYLIFQRWPTDYSSTYQILLSIKIVLVAIMIGIALFNRYKLVPQMTPSHPNILRIFVTTTIAEIILGIAVLALVSTFATLSPN